MLCKAHDTARGPDQILYQILKPFPEASLQCLLKVSNTIWETGEYPPSYPLPSQEDSKDLNTGNHRSIAVSSCVCKTMERMINDCLVSVLLIYFTHHGSPKCLLEKTKHNGSSCAFWNFVREGFLNGKHVVSIFFDLEKAYGHLEIWNYERYEPQGTLTPFYSKILI